MVLPEGVTGLQDGGGGNQGGLGESGKCCGSTVRLLRKLIYRVAFAGDGAVQEIAAVE